MALVAHPFTYRGVNILQQQTAVIRAMWVMTTGTTGICHRIAHMLLDKDRLIGFVAAGAELCNRIFKK